jgi:hypothetical protein
MNLLDVLKALGVALLVMAPNVAAAFGAVAIYSIFIAPGHDVSFYESAAQHIAPWSSIAAGIPLFFLAALWFSWRRPGRNGYMFAATSAFFYAAIDLSTIVLSGGLFLLGPIVAASILSKLAAALLGAWAARPH